MAKDTLAPAAAAVKKARKKRERAVAGAGAGAAPAPGVTIPKKVDLFHKLTEEDIKLRKDKEIDVIKARTKERLHYADVREKQREMNLIEKARLKRLNPTAFASENKPVFDMTGQKAADTPEELDNKQRKETIRALGRLSYSAEPKNFVVEKPLKPNAMDIYQAKKIQQRDAIRNQRAFVPVQKL